jgi:hypothetical protein
LCDARQQVLSTSDAVQWLGVGSAGVAGKLDEILHPA